MGVRVIFLSLLTVCLCLTTVHLIPHSHTDPGWKKSFEGYSTSTDHILGNTITILYGNPTYTFHWEVTSFLQHFLDTLKHKEFDGQGRTWKEIIQILIDRKQLEFVGGGLVEHDEALTTYDAIVNSITGNTFPDLLLDGHLYLKKHFNYTVTTGWQVDAFGHSKVTPLIMKGLGIENLIINRIDTRLKSEYNFEFNWNGVFTHILYKHYSNPRFDWEAHGSIDLQEKAREFIHEINERKQFLKNPNEMLFFWGDDMRFQRSFDAYSTMDGFITTVNSMSGESGIFVKYSRVSEYFAKLDARMYPSWDGVDFFPYMDEYPFDVWTGYYSLRPHVKKLTRESDGLQRSLEQLSSFADLDERKLVRETRFLNALFQHHDAITGTHNDYTNANYIEKFANHSKIAQKVIRQSICSILSKKDVCRETIFLKKHALSLHNKESRVLILYNPLPWNRRDFVKIQTLNTNVEIRNMKNEVVLSQVHKNVDDFVFDIVFEADLPAMGVTSYSIHRIDNRTDVIEPTRNLTINQGNLKFFFRENDYSSSYYSYNGKTHLFSQQYYQYLSLPQRMFGNGQYIFRVNWGMFFLIGLGIGVIVGFLGMIGFRKHIMNLYNRIYALSIALFLSFWILHLVFSLMTDDMYLFSTNSPLHFGFPFGIILAISLILAGGFKNFFVFFVFGLLSLAFFNFGHPEFLARHIPTQNTDCTIFNGPLTSQFEQNFDSWKQVTIVYKDRSYFDIRYSNIHSMNDLITRIEMDHAQSTISTDSNGLLMTERTFQPLRFMQTNYYPVTSRVDLDARLTMYPSHSLGVTRFKSYFDVMLYRNSVVDDERGLDKLIHDTSPSETTLRFHLEPTLKFKGQLEMNNPILIYDVHPKYNMATWKANFEVHWSPIDPKYQTIFGEQEIDFTSQYKQGKNVLRFFNPKEHKIQLDLQHLFTNSEVSKIAKTNLNLLNPKPSPAIVKIDSLFNTYTCQVKDNSH